MLAHFLGLFSMLPFCQNFKKAIGVAFETMPKLVVVVIRELCFFI